MRRPPEELLAASPATCFGIGLRPVLARRGGTACHVRVTAAVTADRGSSRLRIQAAHSDGVVEGLARVEPAALEEIGRAAEEACTISAVLRATVPVTVSVCAVRSARRRTWSAPVSAGPVRERA